jgi:Metallo-peptidase family M12B Reprolysin-like
MHIVAPSSPDTSRGRRPCWPASLLAAALLAAAAPAQVFDLSIVKIEVNQAIQTGATPLVAGRSTFVRTVLRVKNPPTTTVPIDGLLHVIVDGVEAPYSPIFSDNGPYPAQTQINMEDENGTLNFMFLAPTSNNVVVRVEVNPPGPNFVPEPDTSNNTAQTLALAFVTQTVNEIAYVPIDYRPTGGSIPNLPNLQQIEPGSGDNFVAGIYPVSDWLFHRQDNPSKLWTSSLEPDGTSLLNSLQADQALMSPVPDFSYGFVPGALSYNGVSFIGGSVAMGNTELVRFQRTMAHEMGHNFGLNHNTVTDNVIGVDQERQLHITQNLPLIKPASLKDIMYAGLLTPEAWVSPNNYNFFFNSFHFDPGPKALAQVPGPLFVAGVLDRAAGAVSLTDLFELPVGRPSEPDLGGTADLVVRAFSGGALVAELPLAARGTGDSCADSPAAITRSGFFAILDLHGATVDRLAISPAPGKSGATLELQRSPAAPVVSFVSPSGPGVDGHVHVEWQASDADGDALTYYLRYTPDGSRWIPILTSTQQSSIDVDLTQLPRLLAGQGRFEVYATDGLNTTRAQTGALAPSGSYADSAAVGSAPWVYITTPDSGLSYLRGGTVILHGNAWDLEDNALSGASLVWTSDLDGPIGTGRLTSRSTLSVGTHVITLTATDADGNTATDTSTITILDRGLPTVGPICQADLGFGGPGSSELSVCGGDLSTGTTADLQLAGAPASTPAFLFIGTVQGAAPLKGGTLVPVPWTLMMALSTDANGKVLIPALAGGGGPLSVYTQFVVQDPSQTLGWGLSNAVRIDLLP